ncbi:MAG: PAS domain-containing sensor histidine kinase [Myxococcales bacterium]|nr:PAS domain-containing sensor histidine kinase [Myxococcales bacterium]
MGGGAGAGWERSVHPADLDRVRAAWASSVAAGSAYQCQLRLQRRTGGHAWVLARAAPIARSGVVREWIGMMTDITERVRVDEARERFIGILGHDLRSPLAAIQMGVEILADLPKTDATILERVGRSAKRMEAMIRDLLDFTRGQLGDGIPVSPRPCDLGRLATDVLAEIQQANPARVMGLRRTGDLRGQWDPDRIEQVLSNLLGNAVAHGTGPIDLAVRDSGEAVVMTVHSEGAPIPKPKLATLFEPFSGVAAGSSGLGLGLFIASEIVRAHQGTLAVSSAAGEGTTFTIRWPRRQTSEVPAVLPD